jgi:hypothetical protein
MRRIIDYHLLKWMTKYTLRYCGPSRSRRDSSITETSTQSPSRSRFVHHRVAQDARYCIGMGRNLIIPVRMPLWHDMEYVGRRCKVGELLWGGNQSVSHSQIDWSSRDTVIYQAIQDRIKRYVDSAGSEQRLTNNRSASLMREMTRRRRSRSEAIGTDCSEIKCGWNGKYLYFNKTKMTFSMKTHSTI